MGYLTAFCINHVMQIKNREEDSLRQRLGLWLNLTHCPGVVGCYRFTTDGHPTLLSSCFSVFIHELLDLLQAKSKLEQQDWTSYLRNSQEAESGLFIDPLLKPDDLSDGLHSRGYLDWQTTMFGISALDALGQLPDHSLNFLTPYRDSAHLQAWLLQRDLSNPWMMSNEIMFLMFFFSYEYLRKGMQGSLTRLELIFDYLNYHRDSRTGFWGTNHGADLYNAMAGAYHFLPFYAFFDKALPHAERMIDSILALQNPCDGLFLAKGGGGACEDMDAVGTLIILTTVTRHREQDIVHALQKVRQAIKGNQRPDGGFSWSQRKPYGIQEWLHAFNPFLPHLDLHTIYVLKRSAIAGPFKTVKSMCHAGWEKMRFKVDQSDMWSTYFRLLAIALIERKLELERDGHQWKFRSLPGLGWHSNLAD